MFKTGIFGTSQEHHYVDVTLGRNKDVLWMSLQKLQDVGWTQLFFLPGGTVRLYFKSIIVLRFTVCVKLTLSRSP